MFYLSMSPYQSYDILHMWCMWEHVHRLNIGHVVVVVE